MKTITVHVTNEDIHLGMTCNASRCPIALAVARVVGKDVSVAVQPNEVSFESEVVCLSAKLPVTAGCFVENYDDGEPVYPFDFPLDLPDEFPLPAEVA